MPFEASISTVIPPKAQQTFDMWHPTIINISCPDPNGAIRVVLQLAKCSRPYPFGPFELMVNEGLVSQVINDLRPYMAENPSLAVLVNQVQLAVKNLAEKLEWIPALLPEPSGEVAPSGI